MNSKILRCGYCGIPVNDDNKPLKDKILEKATRILREHGDYRTEKRHGECCVHEEMRQQEQDRYVIVTRDMAIDAGMPEIEGQKTKW